MLLSGITVDTAIQYFRGCTALLFTYFNQYVCTDGNITNDF